MCVYVWERKGVRERKKREIIIYYAWCSLTFLDFSFNVFICLRKCLALTFSNVCSVKFSLSSFSWNSTTHRLNCLMLFCCLKSWITFFVCCSLDDFYLPILKFSVLSAFWNPVMSPSKVLFIFVTVFFLSISIDSFLFFPSLCWNFASVHSCIAFNINYSYLKIPLC